MYGDKSLEREPGFNPEEEKRGEYAELWEEANMMEGAPEFQGEDPYNPQILEEDEERNEFQDGTAKGVSESATEAKMNKKFGGAEDLTSYGLDTAAKIYGLDTVLKAVEETDETDRDALDPMGSIYERIAPNPDERANLYREMRKDDEETDKNERKEDEPVDVNNAIHQMKVLLDALENDPRFSSVRERAEAEGKDVVSYLTSDAVNPTLSNFFDGLDAASGGSVEEILDEIEEEEKAKEKEELAEKISEGAENGEGFEGINPEMLQ